MRASQLMSGKARRAISLPYWAHQARQFVLVHKGRSLASSTKDGAGHYRSDQKNYNDSWQLRLDKLVEYIESGESNIPDVLALYRNYWLSGRYGIDEKVPFVVDGQSHQLLASSGHIYYRHAMAHSVLAQVRPDTVAIIELGSGFGESLFTVWHERFGDRKNTLRRNDTKFIASELSPAGRRASRVLATLDPLLNFEGRHFDYRTPRFDGLDFGSGHVVIFSTQSIEQVSEIPDDFLPRVMALGRNVTGLHFEPIGWQFTPQPEPDFVTRHRERCLSLNYNTNYWSMLDAARREQKIEIEIAEPQYLGFEYNPLSKIVWKKKV